MALLVGLTGGIGSGKTLAASMFRELGAHIIDADILSRELVCPEQPAWKEIVEVFGNEILSADRSVDRAKLADIIFNDKNKKESLESIIHPKVFEEEQRIYEEIRSKDPHAVVIVDAPLLIESGNYQKMDRTIVVSCDEEIQIRRAMEMTRLSREQVDARLRNQMSLDEKRKKADWVLENDSTIDSLKLKVESLYQQIKALA